MILKARLPARSTARGAGQGVILITTKFGARRSDAVLAEVAVSFRRPSTTLPAADEVRRGISGTAPDTSRAALQ